MSTTTRTSSIHRAWVDRIDSGTFTKSQARQFAATAGRLAIGEKARGHRTNLTAAEAADLLGRIIVRGVRLDEATEAAGIDWLRRHGQRELYPPLPDVLDGFSHFTYHGGVELGEWNNYGASWPVWRVHLADGRRFNYFAPPHQYGMNPGAIARWWWQTPELDRAEAEGNATGALFSDIAEGADFGISGLTYRKIGPAHARRVIDGVLGDESVYLGGQPFPVESAS